MEVRKERPGKERDGTRLEKTRQGLGFSQSSGFRGNVGKKRVARRERVKGRGFNNSEPG